MDTRWFVILLMGLSTAHQSFETFERPADFQKPDLPQQKSQQSRGSIRCGTDDKT